MKNIYLFRVKWRMYDVWNGGGSKVSPSQDPRQEEPAAKSPKALVDYEAKLK